MARCTQPSPNRLGHTTERTLRTAEPACFVNKRCLRTAHFGNLYIYESCKYSSYIQHTFQTTCITYKARQAPILGVHVDLSSAIFIQNATHHRAAMLGGVCLRCRVVCAWARLCRGSPVIFFRVASLPQDNYAIAKMAMTLSLTILMNMPHECNRTSGEMERMPYFSVCTVTSVFTMT